MPPKNLPKPKKGSKGTPKVPLKPVVVVDIPKPPKAVVVVKTPLKRSNVVDDLEGSGRSKSRRSSGDISDDGAESDADLEIELAKGKRALLTLKLERIKSEIERLRSLELDDADDPVLLDEDVGDDANSPGISPRIKKSSLSRLPPPLSFQFASGHLE